MKDNATKEKFTELRAQGWSFDKIATELNTAKKTLIGWSSDLSIELANASQIQLDRLLEI